MERRTNGPTGNPVADGWAAEVMRKPHSIPTMMMIFDKNNLIKAIRQEQVNRSSDATNKSQIHDNLVANN